MKKILFVLAISAILWGCATAGAEKSASMKVFLKELPGTWKLTHGGRDFVKLRIWKEDKTLKGEVIEYLGDISWTPFEFVSIIVQKDTFQIQMRYPEFQEYVYMTLRILPDGNELVGHINGPTYTRPYTIYGIRLE